MNEIESRFIAAIAADPEDREARTVYADYLEQQGDPRGEFLRLEAQLHSIPERLDQLLLAIDPAWVDAVARRYDLVLFAPGPDKIMAIKGVREVTGHGLKHAKDLVEAATAHHPTYLKRDLELPEARRLRAVFDGNGSDVRLVPRNQKP